MSTIAAIAHMTPEATKTPSIVALDVDAGEARGLAVVADRVERPAPMRGVQEDGEGDEQTTKMSELQGIGVPPIVPKPRFWYHSGKLRTPRSLRMICAMPR